MTEILDSLGQTLSEALPSILGALLLFCIGTVDIFNLAALIVKYYLGEPGPDIHDTVVPSIIIAIDIYPIANQLILKSRIIHNIISIIHNIIGIIRIIRIIRESYGFSQSLQHQVLTLNWSDALRHNYYARSNSRILRT